MIYGRTTITAVPVTVGITFAGPSHIQVRIVSGTGPVFIGKKSVTPDEGFRLEPGDEPLSCVIGQDEAMWAVKQSGTSVLCWMQHTERIPF